MKTVIIAYAVLFCVFAILTNGFFALVSFGMALSCTVAVAMDNSANDTLAVK
jgi:membrane protein implicated in regulation of membrane protease activity